MKTKDEKVYVGIPVPLIVIIVIFLEIFAVSGIKSYDVKKYGDRFEEQSTSASTTEDDNSDTTHDKTEIATEEPSTDKDDSKSDDLSVKDGLLHKKKEAWNRPKTCSTIEECFEIVNEYILSGSDDKLEIETVGVSEEDIKSLASEYMTQTFGRPKSYKLTSVKNSDRKKLTMEIEYEESYYVYRYVVYGDEIPQKEKRALKLYDEIDKMLKEVDLASMSDYQKELYFHDYIIKYAEYDYDAVKSESRTDAHSVYGVFVNRKCVCEGYARAMGLLLSIAGIDNYYVDGEAYSTTVDGVYNEGGPHGWNMVKIENNWYLLDATWDDGKGDVVNYSYFNVNDEIINSSRATNHRELYPECTSLQMNYYVKNNMCFDTFEEYKNYVSSYAGTTDKTEIKAMVLDYSEEKYDFSEIQKLLDIPSMRYLVNRLSDNYVEITLYTY